MGETDLPAANRTWTDGAFAVGSEAKYKCVNTTLSFKRNTIQAEITMTCQERPKEGALPGYPEFETFWGWDDGGEIVEEVPECHVR